MYELFCLEDKKEMLLVDYNRIYLCDKCKCEIYRYPKQKSLQEAIDEMWESYV